MTIIVNRFNAFDLTIFKIFRIFRKKFSRSFVKFLDKQKIFASVSVRSIRCAQIESSISNFFKIAIFYNSFSRFSADLFFEIPTFFYFSSNFFLCASISNNFRDYFLRRFYEFVDFCFSKKF